MSTAWVFFDLKKALTNEDSNMVLECRYCKQKIRFKRESGTTKSLSTHAKMHKKLWAAAEEINLKANDAHYSMENFELLREKVERQKRIAGYFLETDVDLVVLEFLMWIISADVPLYKFRNKYWNAFKDSVGVLSKGQVKLPGKKTMTKLLEKISYVAEKTAIQSIKASGSVALAIDMWTSVAKDHYLGVTYHWITEDFQVQSRVMDLFPFFGSATGPMIAKVLEERFDDTFGDDVILSAMVSDEGSNVKWARDHLVPYDSETCVPHRLQRAILQVTQRADGNQGRHFCHIMSQDVSSLESWMANIRCSQAQLEELTKLLPQNVEFRIPKLGNDTRWWGKYLMIERVLYLKQGLHSLAEEIGVSNVQTSINATEDFLTFAYWKRIGEYKKIFETLHILSVKSQADQIETKSRMVRLIREAEKALQDGCDAAEEPLKVYWAKMLESYQEKVVPIVEGVNNTTIACVLNAKNYERRQEDALQEEAEDEKDFDFSHFKYSEYHPKHLSIETEIACWEELAREAVTVKTRHEKKRLEADDASAREISAKMTAISCSVESCIMEQHRRIERAVRDVLGGREFHLLDFWRDADVSSSTYLLPAIRATLCIPASAAGPERLFSVTGRHISADRNQFLPETVRAMNLGKSFLDDPPSDLGSWSTRKRKREKLNKYRTVSAETLKEEFGKINVDEEIQNLDEIEASRDVRRRIMDQEWEMLDDEEDSD